MTVTDEDRKAADKWMGNLSFEEMGILLGIIKRFSQAAYAAGLERAAVIAENYGGKTAYVLATAIRAEKDKT